VSGRLAGKTAVVVGAGQTPGPTIGNGKAIAVLFAREGARVVCVDRDIARAEETVAEIVAEGGTASTLQADVRQVDDCARLIADAHARLGRIDVLVNNVGTGRGDGPVDAIDPDAYELVMNVNLRAMVLTTRAVLPIMREQKAGAIVNISSLAALAGNDKIAYEVSKAGVNRLTLSTASANAKYGVRANAIMPGLMDTPMAITGISERLGVDQEDLRAKRNARVPLGAMGSGWDTAYAALFLASDEAKFITGAILPVDGGMSTRVG
jgi:NAD(P)-dependent dehydrogenase (short-subunit alcohol dehydrogenase family)